MTEAATGDLAPTPFPKGKGVKLFPVIDDYFQFHLRRWRLAAAVKWQPRHCGGDAAIANLHFNRLECSCRRAEIRHPQRPVETRREGPARHRANLALAHKKLVTLAGHAPPVLSTDSNQPPLEPVALLRGERRCADELAPELHERIEA